MFSCLEIVSNGKLSHWVTCGHKGGSSRGLWMRLGLRHAAEVCLTARRKGKTAVDKPHFDGVRFYPIQGESVFVS
jgi:hypothetical protein